MPLSAPVSRKVSHTRQIQCEGFLREDGLWDIEATLLDTKSYPYPHDMYEFLPPGQALHQMAVRLTVDDDLRVHAIEVCIDAAPFSMCPAIVERFQSLQGLQINLGWRYEVRKRLGGVLGCTHLVELLSPVATTAYQTIYTATREQTEKFADSIRHEDNKPLILNTCHALASESPVVKRHWPQFYSGDE